MKKYLLLVALTMLVFAGCEKTGKPEVEEVTTKVVDAIGSTYASAGARFRGYTCETYPERGVVWATSPAPTISNFKYSFPGCATDGTAALTGLTTKTVYYVRSYIKSNTGIVYGNELSFTTL